eukprot:gnl/MRDRNA2_/MRDRNA2_79733_c0_seq3.p1 gnl/MRDRNA2_/MRDRNA2_79733_c0~~gnl/MRDRNA2_/MRDRNA2_79733_c0_seq3.p1  ORF type:complete len:443 (-),score=79.64 gnl/MRDRNA2_/MRDRNA2_79733_c0_seq3:346-1635(-)
MATTESSKRQHEGHGLSSERHEGHDQAEDQHGPSSEHQEGHDQAEHQHHDAINSEKANDRHDSITGSMAALHAASHMKTSQRKRKNSTPSSRQTHDGHKDSEHKEEQRDTDKEHHEEQHHEENKNHHASVGAMLAANAAKKLHDRHLQLHEEDLSTDKQLWEIMLKLKSRMSMYDFSCIIRDAFDMGLVHCFPTTGAHMIKLTPARAMTLAIKLVDSSDSTIEELCNVASGVEDDTKLSDVLPDERLGGESLADMDMHVFLRFIQVLADVMNVEKQVVVSFLVWVLRRHFELADSQYDKLWNVVKAARPREHKDGVLRLDSSDVEVLMRSADVIQAEGFTAERCSHGFTKFLKHNEELMKARMEARPGHEISHHDHFTAHRHELRGGAALVGRTEMSVFLFELWNDASNHLQHRFQNPYSLAAALAACT